MAKKYKIERNLVLNDIKEGGAEDSVLVIDANNEVGSVPRSEFGSGGGSQTLDEVLENGNQAENKSLILNYNDGIGDNYSQISSGGISIVRYNSTIGAEYGDGGMTQSDEAGNRVQLSCHYLNFKNGANNEETNFLPAHYGANSFYIPVSVNGKFANENGNINLQGLTSNIAIAGGGFMVFTNGILTDVIPSIAPPLEDV